jgi:hypothetical protein
MLTKPFIEPKIRAGIGLRQISQISLKKSILVCWGGAWMDESWYWLNIIEYIFTKIRNIDIDLWIKNLIFPGRIASQIT